MHLGSEQQRIAHITIAAGLQVHGTWPPLSPLFSLHCCQILDEKKVSENKLERNVEAT